MSDEAAIRAVVERWVVARDAGHWDVLLGTWHKGGRMRTSWSEGTAVDFIAAVRKSFDDGLVVHHFLGGTMVDVSGSRAIAQSKMTIASRVPVDGVECDIVCTGRFYDFFELREGRWGIVLRQPIYEKDRVDTVEPGATVEYDRELLASLPSGCRWLLYSQKQAGLPVNEEQPEMRGALVEKVYEAGAAWLRGEPAPGY